MGSLPVLQDDVPLPEQPDQVLLPPERFFPGIPQPVLGLIEPSAAFFGDSDETRETAFYTVKASRIREIGAAGLWLGSFSSLLHARRAVLGARRSGLPVFLCVSHAPGEEELLAGMLCLQELGIAAFGLSGPFERIEPLTRRLSAYAKLPLLAMPELDRPPKVWSACLRWLLEAGIRVFGVGASEEPYHDMAAKLCPQYDNIPPKYPDRPESAPLLLTNNGAVFYLREDFTLSEPIDCALDMTKAILSAEANASDALLFRIGGPDCAEHFALNLPLIQGAVCLLAHDAPALDYCLKAYPGRALVDARSEIGEAELERIAGAYGAIIR